MNDESTADTIRQQVREAYGKIAREGGGCGCAASACCPPGVPAPEQSRRLGYSPSDLDGVPDGADLGLGCGNPHAIAALREGETVLDLGSGGGLDVFLAAQRVGAAGRVIGVDMTPDMIAKARANARTVGATNVEFRLGEIERLPVADASVDVILSNCVINLSPNKRAVFDEAFRALRPGGRLAVSDVVATAAIPEALKNDLAAYTGCVAGAAHVDDLRAMLEAAGFTNVRIAIDEARRALVGEWFPGTAAERYVASATIEAEKPTGAAACCGPACCT